MKPEHEDLARRAVACPRWRWVPGMLIVDYGAGIRFLWEDDLYLHGMAAEVGGLWMRMGKDRERLPDLTDPATLGCLLALVREAWSEPILSAAWGGGHWYVVQRVHPSVDALRWIDAATEVEALVAALEAAP